MTKSIKFKRTLFASLTLCVVAAAITFALAAKANRAYGAGKQDYWNGLAPQRCNLGTLRGAYGLNVAGTFFLPSPPGSPTPLTPVPAVALNYYLFDGNGNSQGTATTSFNGTISRSDFTGTYTVNENCTGKLVDKLPNGFAINSEFIIVDGGQEVFMIETDPNTLINGSLKRIKSAP